MKRFLVLMGFVLASVPTATKADVSASKLNSYAILDGSGLAASKLNSYAVLDSGVIAASKLNSYAVLKPPVTTSGAVMRHPLTHW